MTNGPDVVESRVALRTNNTKLGKFFYFSTYILTQLSFACLCINVSNDKFVTVCFTAGSGIKRGSLKLIPPSEREERLRLKKLRFINNVDANSLFKGMRSGKKQGLNTKENDFPHYSTSLFDNMPRTNDLINEIDNFDVIEGTATSSTR